MSHLELVAGDLEWLDDTASNRRRKRQATIPRDVDPWVQEIARALQYAAEVSADETGDCHLGALLTAIIVRSCLHRRRPRMTNRELIFILRTIPGALLRGEGEVNPVVTFARWYLETHAALGLVSAPLSDAVWSRIEELEHRSVATSRQQRRSCD